MSPLEPLLGKTLAELEAIAASLAMPTFAAKQMAHWLYQKRVPNITDMTNISSSHRAALAEKYEVGLRHPLSAQASRDGTKKYLFSVAGEKAAHIESVFIPDGDRATLCISSQAGCRMGCRFCMTARMGFVQQLSSGDIISQIFGIAESPQLSNLVFMGMGEPLDNADELLKALNIITAPWGMAWSPTRVTVSTIGLLPALRRFLDESRCHLALSLHNPFADERRELVPMQKAFPIADTLAEIRRHDWRGQRRVSFEYILFAGLNDTPQHATALARLLQNLECRINLIRFHQIPDSPLRGTPTAGIERFRDTLQSKGFTATIRASRGEDILAACGMLALAG
ncbi:MAG: 23S rRNA (adenine(2503)-C(2))-methyltransferase RlmN [Prevotellaceae bacterium]|jgi:23S rRNA (adenine2503-C2)-methyltransferase|nr:23S rRNA (adenine(2503)-C(2))-methyltransferase RlmN [Prevotellaceae bacterium]